MNHLLTIFAKALGEHLPSPKILDALVEIGEGFIESPSPFSEVDFYWEFFTRGVSFNFENKQLIQIAIYCENFENYNTFPFQLFENFPNNANSQEVEKHLDIPLKKGGGENSSYLGYIKPWWQYSISGCLINFDFNAEGCIFAISLNNHTQ